MRFSGSGHELDYEVHGEGRALVFVHGLTLDRALLREAVEPVFQTREAGDARAARVGWRRVYLDLPGHGASPAEGAGALASADGLIGLLGAFVAEIGGERPLVVGHAYGGYLAQGLVAAGPELGGLFLVCPVVEPDFAARRLPPQRHAVTDPALEFTGDDERQLFDGEAAVHTAAVLEAFRRIVAPAHLATDRDFVAAVRSRYASSLPLRSAARGLGAPAALVCGRDDYWAGFLDAAELAAALPRSSLAVVPDCGTLLPLEAPARLAAELLDWLARCAAG